MAQNILSQTVGPMDLSISAYAAVPGGELGFAGKLSSHITGRCSQTLPWEIRDLISMTVPPAVLVPPGVMSNFAGVQAFETVKEFERQENCRTQIELMSLPRKVRSRHYPSVPDACLINRDMSIQGLNDTRSFSGPLVRCFFLCGFHR